MQKNKLYYCAQRSRSDLAKIFGTFLSTVILKTLEHHRTEYYLEKNTWNILWYDKILELLPDARLVHIYRDPRDIVASYTRQSWMPTEATKAAQIYIDLMQR